GVVSSPSTPVPCPFERLPPGAWRDRITAYGRDDLSTPQAGAHFGRNDSFARCRDPSTTCAEAHEPAPGDVEESTRDRCMARQPCDGEAGRDHTNRVRHDRDAVTSPRWSPRG